MQSKGALKLFTILLVVGCIYQLAFSFISRGVEKDAVEYAAAYDEAEQAAMEAYYLDSYGEALPQQGAQLFYRP